MRQVKISPVQYEMLVALGKRWRMKPEQLISELIEENYKNKTKLNDESTCPQQMFLMLVQTMRLTQNHLFSAYILWHQSP